MDEKQTFDIAIIGAGPGGYVAAIKAAQRGKKVALIEKEFLGGTCLNVGCIPTKTLLANAQLYHKIKRAHEYGIEVGKTSCNYGKMKERKDSVVTNIRNSLTGLLKSNHIHIFEGHASFQSQKELKISGKETTIIHADKTIIATGSAPFDMPAFPCDHKRILNSTSVLNMTELPKKIAVIGGGYIGCEFASLFQELGVEVTIIEALQSIIMAQGKELASALTESFKKAGIEILTETFVERIEKKDKGLTVHLKGGKSLESDIAIVAVGRRIVTEGLALEKIGLATHEKGFIEVNERMETNVPGIYAIGDVTGKAMLAHVASHQAIVASENACGREMAMHYKAVPAVIFTHPEIATVGMTLEQAKEAGHDAIVGKFPFQALGKSQATIDTEGFAQIVSNKKTGEILGAQIIGHEASTMIAEMALAIHNELTLECVADTIHAHPTVAEAWLEAALIANETPIHFPPKIKRKK